MSYNTPAISLDLAYEYLDRAEELLACPREGYAHSWIKNMLAVDSQGYSCNPESDLAVAYCEIGAVKAVTHYDNNPDAAYHYVVSLLHAANPNAIAAIDGHNSQGGIPSVNDRATSFDKILNMFERAKNLTLKLQARALTNVPTKN